VEQATISKFLVPFPQPATERKEEMVNGEDDFGAILKTCSQQVVWVPIVGLLVGVLYNVGYFGELGIGYFGVFSLSEHIVFAFQALPFALALMLFTGTMALATIKAPPHGIWAGMSALLGLSGIGVSIYNEHFMVVFVFVSFAFLVLVVFVIKAIPAAAKILVAIFVIGACSVFLGAEAGRDATMGLMPYTLEYADSKVAGNLLRAGDKAILFSTTKKILELVKCPDIKKIARTKN
jgi:hypothetical protein